MKRLNLVFEAFKYIRKGIGLIMVEMLLISPQGC
ncbi:hypothetical protein SAMN05443144_13313 [Fodinibius roseus]|uniref:Uncharacterized protein n=1 Tax=Fodinibius roseus TaxID=1194090 RepID=A0A1M5KN83_9BACT|nr:hypothetical protein SAMN05443144_13313 [Fodinibius roseus]